MSRSTRSIGAISALTALLLASTASAQSNKIAFIADMDAAQVITGSTSTARGTAVVIVDPQTNVANIEVAIEGLAGAESASHIHGYAVPGAGGPPQHTLPNGLRKTSLWVYPAVDEASLFSDLAYVKVHTTAFPSGEIRGQLLRVRNGVTLMGKLDGAQAGTASTAKGLLGATIDPLTNQLDYLETITTSLLLGPETASHLHGYAAPGGSGPIVLNLPTGFHKTGSWTYPEPDEGSIMSDLLYSQTHTSAHTGGEIRGQVTVAAVVDPRDRISFMATLDNTQVVAGSTSAARGTAVLTIDRRSNLAEFTLVAEGLAGAESSANIYGYAVPGASGPAQFALPLGRYKKTTWVYPESAETSILNGLAYVQLNTAAFPSGEIRGQFQRVVADYVLVGDMDAAQVITGSASPARGLIVAAVNTTFNTLTYDMTMTTSTFMGTETASHIHGYALPGAGGPPQHTFATLGYHKSGTWVYPQIDEASIVGELAYAKSHTDVNPTGEIRGQLRIASSCEPDISNYCTAGVSASGCTAVLNASGAPSATLSSGFTLSSAGFEGAKDGLFFFGTNGQQANSWGNGTSFQCVVPPVSRAGLLLGSGTNGACNNFMSQDLNALWCPTCPKPLKNPGAGAVVQAQLWYRDPQNTSNQTTSLSDAVQFTVCP